MTRVEIVEGVLAAQWIDRVKHRWKDDQERIDQIAKLTLSFRGDAEAVVAALDVWQPIETAPRDGTAVVLCWAIDADGGRIDWESDPHTAGVFVQIASWGENDGWTVYCDMVCDPRLHFKPTHWMPIPAPPCS